MGINYAPEMAGIAPYTTGLATRLAAAGHEVRVLTAFPHYPSWNFPPGTLGWSAREQEGSVIVQRLRHVLPRTTSGVSRLVSEVVFGLRVATTTWGRPDFVLLVSPALFAAGIAMVRARLVHRGTPVGVWVQDLYSLGMRETGSGDRLGFAARCVRAVEARVLRAADSVVVIHEHFVRTVTELGVRSGAATVIRNWTHVRSVDADRAETRRRLGWAPDETIVLHTGNMGVKQDLRNVIAAARAADQAQAPVRFVLLGDGGERSALERDAAGVRRLEIAPPLPNEHYMAVLQAADVLLVNEHPGLRAMAVPSKLTSYFASGRPVVAATHPDSLTASELRASGAGLRVDPGAPAALLEAVLRLRRARRTADRLGARGQVYRDQVLTEDAAVERFLSWLGGICRSPAAGPVRSTAAA